MTGALLGTVFGAVGFGYMAWGKRRGSLPAAICGALLAGLVPFLPVAGQLAVGMSLVILPFVYR